MAQAGRSNVRYVDPQRRYTVVLGPSWNAPFGALPHDDRAGTHDGADGRCGWYASIGRGQPALWIMSKNFYRRAATSASLQLLRREMSRRATSRHMRCNKRPTWFSLFDYHVGAGTGLVARPRQSSLLLCVRAGRRRRSMPPSTIVAETFRCG